MQPLNRLAIGHTGLFLWLFAAKLVSLSSSVLTAGTLSWSSPKSKRWVENCQYSNCLGCLTRSSLCPTDAPRWRYKCFLASVPFHGQFDGIRNLAAQWTQSFHQARINFKAANRPESSLGWRQRSLYRVTLCTQRESRYCSASQRHTPDDCTAHSCHQQWIEAYCQVFVIFSANQG